jgi:hypothetical protein
MPFFLSYRSDVVGESIDERASNFDMETLMHEIGNLNELLKKRSSSCIV